MSTSAVVMMLVAMLVVWGGLAPAVLNISRTQQEEPTEVHRDL
ncbi:MAG TPA: methionine/alanine import family NSS transporter small subunit [Nocardioidaceae bacterium]|nr:methionine/alanine import family NSS transporter small subunit [Nocardioidaceae bacterium]